MPSLSDPQHFRGLSWTNSWWEETSPERNALEAWYAAGEFLNRVNPPVFSTSNENFAMPSVCKFRVGDIVIRTQGAWGRMDVGNTDVVTGIKETSFSGGTRFELELSRYGKGHESRFFERWGRTQRPKSGFGKFVREKEL